MTGFGKTILIEVQKENDMHRQQKFSGATIEFVWEVLRACKHALVVCARLP